MFQSHLESEFLKESKPLQSIKTVEQSLLNLKSKLSQMSRKQCDNVRQIQKVFYSSIPILKTKLSQSLEYEKTQYKKKHNFNDNILRQRMQVNRQKKMINEKQIQRNRQLINIMKMNEHNSIKQLSKRNELYIQKMKSQKVQQNRRKRQLIKGGIQHSRMKVKDFHTSKIEELKRLKQEENNCLQKKMAKMMAELGTLNNKQNQTAQKVLKTNQALKQLRQAVNKLSKMNEEQFIKLKSSARKQQPLISEERLIEKILTKIIQRSKLSESQGRQSKTLHSSKYQSEHLSKNS